MENEKIILVEDEEVVLYANERMLKRRGYNILTAQSVKEALDLLEIHTPDMLILDMMLPDGSGIDICSHFRKTSDKPVLFLSAKSDIPSKIDSLKNGADYYLTKPFNMNELIAVIERLLERENNIKNSNSISKYGLTLDLAKFSATLNGKDISLTKREFAILHIFLQNENKKFSSEELYETVWGLNSNQDIRVLRTHISNLRNKIDCKNSEKYAINSYYGSGYAFETK